jgi:anti-sigma B factor antagonist
MTDLRAARAGVMNVAREGLDADELAKFPRRRDGYDPAALEGAGPMLMNVVELDANVRKIELVGRLDTLGAGAVELRYAAVASGRASGTIVDLSGVDFLASMGVRMLVSCAKAGHARGGRTVLVGARPLVEQTLRVTGIDQLIPLAADETAARQILAT